ncbi:hypothetical protein [Synechococcus sp. MVIR-18-1]|uniref:hypothetical protein n=1 Tax=Synechococcus sp. MVIR-18-1 TaxID=1386941 RepID=UPI001648ADB6|nr:hypothetical protein [Synechococcus sp. MVIR-18-1]
MNIPPRPARAGAGSQGVVGVGSLGQAAQGNPVGGQGDQRTVPQQPSPSEELGPAHAPSNRRVKANAARQPAGQDEPNRAAGHRGRPQFLPALPGAASRTEGAG